LSARIGTYPVPSDPLVEHLSAAVVRLRGRLLSVNAGDLAVSEYSRKYFVGTLVNGVSKLNLYAYLVYLAMRNSTRRGDLGSVAIVDYGGGNGLLSLLAREAGFGIVVYSDIDERSAADARQLGAAVGLEADHYVVGELEHVSSYLRSAGIDCEAFCSYDVVEHVYNIDAFLRGMRDVSRGPIRVVHGSGANDRNPRLRRRLMAAQRQVESEDRSPEWGHKERDATAAYARIRREMISAVSATLSPAVLADLVSRTRGMAKHDIEAAVRRYLDVEQLPPLPDHPTNTCDPWTGNWAEHLMDPYLLAQTLRSVGFRAQVLPGYYNPYLGRKGTVAGALNQSIKVAGRRGLFLAPYFVLVGERGA
jgi:hypothetical protein